MSQYSETLERKMILNIRKVQTSNFTCAEPNTHLGWPKLLSSTVDLDGRTLHGAEPNSRRKEISSLLLKIGK